MTSGAFDDELLDACRDAQACAVFFEVARQLGADRALLDELARAEIAAVLRATRLPPAPRGQACARKRSSPVRKTGNLALPVFRAALRSLEAHLLRLAEWLPAGCQRLNYIASRDIVTLSIC